LAAQRLGKPELALEVLRPLVISGTPTERKCALWLRSTLAPSGERDQYLLEALSIDPDFFPALIGMSEFETSQKRYTESIEYADRAIFVLGWPLEWTEIIVIFVPIFLPMLSHFNIDPILWGTLVFVNLQAAFLSPPVAMSAFYLKGVAPPHVTLNQIFAGMMPYMFIVIICMAIMYVWPGMTLWLPKYLYGGG